MRKTRKDTGASLLPPEQTPPPTPPRDCRRGLKVVDGCGLAAALASKGGRRRRCPRQRRWGTPPQAHPAPPVPACIPRPACLIRQGASFEPRDPYSPPPALPSPRPLCCFPFSLFLFCLDWPAWSAGLNRSPPASPAARGTAATRAAPRRRRRGRPHRLRPMPSVPRQLRWGTPPPHATLPRTTLFRSYPPLRSSPARARALQRTPPALSDKLTRQRLPPPCCFSFFFSIFLPRPPRPSQFESPPRPRDRDLPEPPARGRCGVCPPAAAARRRPVRRAAAPARPCPGSAPPPPCWGGRPAPERGMAVGGADALHGRRRGAARAARRNRPRWWNGRRRQRRWLPPRPATAAVSPPRRRGSDVGGNVRAGALLRPPHRSVAAHSPQSRRSRPTPPLVSCPGPPHGTSTALRGALPRDR